MHRWLGLKGNNSPPLSRIWWATALIFNPILAPMSKNTVSEHAFSA